MTRRCLFLVFLVMAITAPVSNAVVAQAKPPTETAQAQTAKEEAWKGSKDVDEAVSYPMDAVVRAAKQAMETYGCEIKKEQPDYLEGTRSRHVGVFVGSGGEKVKVNLTKEGDGTHVKIETGKGFVGRVGKKNWSTPIFKEMMRILQESTAKS